MGKIKLFRSKTPWQNIASHIPNAIETINSMPPKKYNTNFFRELAFGFKTLLYAMEKDQNSEETCQWFLKWFKVYVKLQHQMDSNESLRSKFESKIPSCTSYVLASLQYQNRIENYHQNIMEMCLLLFKSAQPHTMQKIANLDIQLIAQLWIPVEFVGDYITQRMCLKLIVAVLKHLSVEERQTKVSEANLDKEIEQLILKLLADPMNFEEVSRELLNVYNMTLSRNCTVFSIYCTKALFGSSELFKPDKVTKFWIDFNYTSKCVSLLCQLNQSEGKQEEFYIKIKIYKLEIENQFDCSVYTIEQPSFSTNVSEQLLSSRVAVFTLPKDQLQILKSNGDLMDYYNTSYSESSQVSTPNTIVKYLADLSEDSLVSPYSANNSDIPKMKRAKVKLQKCNDLQRECRIVSMKSHNKINEENNATANSTPLVVRIDYIPNYAGPSINGSENNLSEDTITIPIFKKPKMPIKYKSTKKSQSISAKVRKIQNKLVELPNPEVMNVYPNKPERQIINSIYSKTKPDMTPVDNIEQNKSSSMPFFESGTQAKSQRRESLELTRDEISVSYTSTSIQVSRNSIQFSNVHKQPVKQQFFQNFEHKFVEKKSFQAVFDASGFETNGKPISKSIDINHLLKPEPSDIVLQLQSKESLATHKNPIISTPIQATVIPIQRYPKITKSTELSEHSEILQNQNSSTHKSSVTLSKEIANSDYLNRSPINNRNNSQCRIIGENQATLSQSSDNETKTSSQNVSPCKQKQIGKSGISHEKTLEQSSNINELQKTQNSLEDVVEVPKNTSRRFFKYKNTPCISIAPTTKAKRKTCKKKPNTTEIIPKTKNVNLVKPLNYANDPCTNLNEPVLESREYENSKQIKNRKNIKDKTGIFTKRNEDVKDLKLINETTNRKLVPNPIKRRTGKRKTLLKEVKVSNFVPYSIWKNRQKNKNNDDPIVLSPKQNPQKEITSDTESNRSSKDTFDKVKHLGIKNDRMPRNSKKNPPMKRRRSSSSESIQTFYFSESENTEDSFSVRNEQQNSLCSEIICRDQPDDHDLIQSPIRVPFERAERQKSTSMESLLTPSQMSLASNCLDALDSLDQPNDSNQQLEYSTRSFVSPVFEDLDEEIHEIAPQYETSPQLKFYNSLLEEYRKEVSPPTKQLSPIFLKSQQLLISSDNNSVKNCLQNQGEEQKTSSQGSYISLLEGEVNEQDANTNQLKTSSQGSLISVYSKDETNEQEVYTNEFSIYSLRKRTHSAENEESSLAKIPALIQSKSLSDYDQLLPEFITKLTIEKNRYLTSIRTKFNEDILDNFNKTVDVISKSIDYHQIAIKEEQEKLSSILENLEWHQKILQKNQSELEKIHGQVNELRQTRDHKTDEINEIYNEAEQVLISYTDAMKREWHSFSKSIVNSVKERLTEYLDI